VKVSPQLPGGKSPGAKVEDGTGFKPVWRHSGVYQRTGRGKASVAEKAKGGLESELGNTREPETPLSGEIVRNPKEGSAQNRFVRVTKPGSDAQELRLEGKAGTLQGGSETW